MLQVHLVYFLSLFENQFVQSPSSFHRRTTQGAKIKGWDMVSASEGLFELLVSHLTDRVGK